MTLNNKYILADKKMLYICTAIVFIYLVFFLKIDFLVNYIISYNPNLDSINLRLAEQQEISKLKIQTLLLAAALSILFMVIGWVSYVIIRTKTIPPKSIKFPFSMMRLSGKDALLIGCVGIGISLIIIMLNIYRIYVIWSIVES